MRARTLYVLGIFICVRAPMSNFLPLYNTTFFLSSQEAFQIFFSVNFSLHRQVCMRAARPSNFMRCQILINQLRTSYDCQILIAATSAANLSSCNSLYIYISPFIIIQILKLIKLQKLSNFHAQILNVSNFDF